MIDTFRQRLKVSRGQSSRPLNTCCPTAAIRGGDSPRRADLRALPPPADAPVRGGVSNAWIGGPKYLRIVQPPNNPANRPAIIVHPNQHQADNGSRVDHPTTNSLFTLV